MIFLVKNDFLGPSLEFIWQIIVEISPQIQTFKSEQPTLMMILLATENILSDFIKSKAKCHMMSNWTHKKAIQI